MAEDEFLLGFLSALSQRAPFKAQDPIERLKDVAAIEQSRASTQKSVADSGARFADAHPQTGLISRMAMAMAGPMPRQLEQGPRDETLGAAFLTRMKDAGASDDVIAKVAERFKARPLSNENLSEYTSAFMPSKAAPAVMADPLTGLLNIINRQTGEAAPVKGQGPAPAGPTPKQQTFLDEEFTRYSKATEDLRTFGSRLNNVRALLNSFNPASIGPFRGQASRVLAGEVGVQTEGDIQRTTGSPALVDRFKRYVKTALSGNFTQTDRDDFNRLLADIESAASNRHNVSRKAYVDRAMMRTRSAGTPLDRQYVEDLFNLPFSFGNQGAVASDLAPGTTTQAPALPKVGDMFQGTKVTRVTKKK